MKPVESNGLITAPGDKKGEIRVPARAVSRGVSIGRIVRLFGNNRQFYRVSIPEPAVKQEIARLNAAFNVARRQLGDLAAGKKGINFDASTGIFEAHRMILEDSSLQSKIEAEISEQRVNAEWAVKLVTDNYVSRYKALHDEHLRDRYIDIEDVSERILSALGVSNESAIRLEKGSIVAAKELKPSTLVALASSGPAGIITENGGWTSHTFIIAREINLPAVTGLKKLLRRVNDGELVIVDGYNGQIILDPDDETLQKYTVAAAHFQQVSHDEHEMPTGITKTLDGREITIRVNADLPSVYKKARSLGARGIGLYRSEFLFNPSKGFPSEQEQVDAYTKIAELAGDEGVKIRTFDLGIEQLPEQTDVREKNPALGLRAIRLALSFRSHLKTQLRALLRASHERRIDIIVPMVSGLSDILEIRKLLESERERLAAAGKPAGAPKLGAMIEVPSAVLMVKELAEVTDFLCLGTNDLVQFLLAADRDNESVSPWFRTLHPAVIRAIKTVITAGREAGKSVIACGEMAGSLYYAPLLIGLGATELSMNVNSILRVRKLISGIAYEEAKKLADSVEPCSTADAVEETVRRHLNTNWAHLFPADFLQALDR